MSHQHNFSLCPKQATPSPSLIFSHYSKVSHILLCPNSSYVEILLRIQVSVQIPILLSFYSSQFIHLIFHSCKHLQLARVCCYCCFCIFSQECDSVTSALFQRLSLYFSISVSYF